MSRNKGYTGGHAAKFKKELLSGTTSLVLLALLESEGRAMYGYEIARHLDEVAGGESPFQGGALYPALRAMERQGYLRSSIVPSVAGPPRKYYAVTAAGRRALAARTELWCSVRDLVDATLASIRHESPRRRVR